MSFKAYGEPLVTSLFLSQGLVCPRNMSLRGVRLHLARIGAPVGNLFVKVYDDNEVELDQSPNVSMANLGTAGTDWFGFVPFNLDVLCAAGDTYHFKLGFSGHTYGESDHVAWLREYNFGANKYTSSTITHAAIAPLDIEIWENKLITKGTYP